MKIKTLRFGELEIDESQIFKCRMGLPGFASMKSFVIIEQEEHYPFKWMQSVDDAAVAFILADPLLFYPTYCAEIPRSELSIIHPEKEQDLALSVIMTITEHTHEISANLCAPLIFNLANHQGMQYVLSDRKYPVKYYLFQEGDSSVVKKTASNPVEPRSLSLR